MFVLYLFLSYATATPEIYTLSLHDALPIYNCQSNHRSLKGFGFIKRLNLRSRGGSGRFYNSGLGTARSEEHTSELQSRGHLVCRLLLDKKTTSPRTLDVADVVSLTRRRAT